jgi:hypothetical protein
MGMISLVQQEYTSPWSTDTLPLSQTSRLIKRKYFRMPWDEDVFLLLKAYFIDTDQSIAME